MLVNCFQSTGAQRIGVHTGPLQQGQIYSGGLYHIYSVLCNMYDCTVDQELNTELLAGSCRMLQAAGCMSTYQVATLFYMKGKEVMSAILKV